MVLSPLNTWVCTRLAIVSNVHNFLCLAHIHTNMQAIMVNHDRFGLFRPTTDEDGKVIHPEWKTMRNVHLDVSQ